MSPNTIGWRRHLGAVGIWSIELRTDPSAGAAAAELQSLGFRALWTPGLDVAHVSADLARLLSAAPGTTVVLGVQSIWRQPASELARQAAQLNAQFAGRLITGLGVSNRETAAASGQAFRSPLGAMSSYLDELDAAAVPLRADQRILGALGPRMAALAGARAAGMHPFLVPPDAAAGYRQILGPSALLAPHLAVVLESDPDRARSIARDSIGRLVAMPSYRNNLHRLGFTAADTVPGGSDRLIDAIVARGDIDSVFARVNQHLDAGADHVALHVLAGIPGPPISQWRELAAPAAAVA